MKPMSQGGGEGAANFYFFGNSLRPSHGNETSLVSAFVFVSVKFSRPHNYILICFVFFKIARAGALV